MIIKNIKVSNFKTFDDLNLDLDTFNLLIGSNASGKSSFISIFDFLKDISENGIDSAISQQGGIEYIRNIKLGSSKNLRIELNLVSEPDSKDLILVLEQSDDKFNGISASNVLYKLDIEFYKKSTKKYKSIAETVELDLNILSVIKDGKDKKPIDSGKIIIQNNGTNITYNIQDFKNEIAKSSFEKLQMMYPNNEKVKNSLLRLQSTPLIFYLTIFLRNLSIYDIDPKLSKKAIPVAGKSDLDRDGGNLAIALKTILEDKKKAKTFSTILKDILPFVDDVEVTSGDKSILANLRETYYKEKFIPAYLISDGTINISALIIALYYGGNPIIIEEPERNIHPYLISKIISMMKDVSVRQKKQIIITTHNPEVVKYSDEKNILFARRNSRGFSEIYRPIERKDIQVFLENDMGVDELYLQNLL